MLAMALFFHFDGTLEKFMQTLPKCRFEIVILVLHWGETIPSFYNQLNKLIRLSLSVLRNVVVPNSTLQNRLVG